MALPAEFVQRVLRELGAEEGAALCAALDGVPPVSVRLNGAKCGNAEELLCALGAAQPVPWCADGWYLAERPQFTFDPAFHAGAYYVQEASSQFVGLLAGDAAGRRILDLCAAPGGKTTLYASLAGPQGLVVANEIDRRRAQVLADNVRKWGTGNVAVTCCEPRALGDLEAWFDVVAVDAPCSGEGMFRKEPEMLKSWNDAMLDFCRKEQAKILEACAGLLRSGGLLLYSTCTFSPEENEESISAFLQNHPEFRTHPIPKEHGFAAGLPPLTDCARLYPHKIRGEGHFLALLEKTGTQASRELQQEQGGWEKEMEPFADFAAEILREKPAGKYKRYGDGLYLLPEEMPETGGLRVLRSGWFLGTLKKGRFEPSQAFAMGLKKEEVRQIVDFPLEDGRVLRYLKGETVESDTPDGWTLVCVDGFPLGWAKAQKGRLKNKYPVSWKWE